MFGISQSRISEIFKNYIKVSWMSTSLVHNLKRNLTRYVCNDLKNGAIITHYRYKSISCFFVKLFSGFSVSFTSKRFFSLPFTVRFHAANTFFLSEQSFDPMDATVPCL